MTPLEGESPAERLQRALGGVAVGAWRRPTLALALGFALVALAVRDLAVVGQREGLPIGLLAHLPLMTLLLAGQAAWRFRSSAAVLAVIVPALATALWTLGFAARVMGGWDGLHPLALAALVGLCALQSGWLLGAAQQAARRGHPPDRAVHLAFGRPALPVTLGAVLAAAAFACLGLARQPVLRDGGMAVATGLLVHLGLATLLVPALLRVLGDRLGSWTGEAVPPWPGYSVQIVRWAPALFWLPALGVLALVGWAPWSDLPLRPATAHADVVPLRAMGPLRLAPPVAAGVLALCWLVRDVRSGLYCLLSVLAACCALLGLTALAERTLAGPQLLVLPLSLATVIAGSLPWVLADRRGGFSAALAQGGRPVLHAVVAPMLAMLALIPGGQGSSPAVGLLALAVAGLASLVFLPAAMALLELRPRTQGPAAVLRPLATVGLAGYAPVAPGTLGALVALPVAAVVAPLHLPARMCVAWALAGLSAWAAERYLLASAEHDRRHVVLDEFAGCVLALAWVPWQPVWVLTTFVLFRVLEALKPWPLPLVARLRGGLGLVAVDALAGTIAGLTAAGLRQLSLTW